VEFAKRPGGRPIPDRIYGATFQLVSQPSRTIVGTVRDRGTGDPVAGVRMEGRGVQSVKTDADGRFELLGLAKGSQYVIDAVPDGVPYFRASARLADAPGIEPLTVGFDLVRGITVRGRVTVLPSGEPIQAHVEYYPLLPNMHVKQLGVIASSTQGRSSADCGPDGSYVIAVLPGPGVLAFSAGSFSPDTYRLYAAALITRQDLADFFHKDAAEFIPPEMLRASQDNRSLPVATGGALGTLISQTSYNMLVDRSARRREGAYARRYDRDRTDGGGQGRDSRRRAAGRGPRARARRYIVEKGSPNSRIHNRGVEPATSPRAGLRTL
jgi:hypothetical protein